MLQHLFGGMAVQGELSATVIRADGSHRDMLLSRDWLKPGHLKQLLAKFDQLDETNNSFWHRLYRQLRRNNAIPLTLGFGSFVYWLHTQDPHGLGLALVTQAGVNVLAADFVSGASTHIASFNYHDSGTGTTAATTSDTALTTQAGPTSRATGTQSNPVAGTYKSVGTVTYGASLAISEWGLFNQAAQGGSLWDHRVFSSISVNSGDSISYSYQLLVQSGGS